MKKSMELMQAYSALMHGRKGTGPDGVVIQQDFLNHQNVVIKTVHRLEVKLALAAGALATTKAVLNQCLNGKYDDGLGMEDFNCDDLLQEEDSGHSFTLLVHELQTEIQRQKDRANNAEYLVEQLRKELENDLS